MAKVLNTADTNCENCAPACHRHALFVQSLGICSAIALTTHIHTTIIIGIIILLTALVSSLIVSLIRKMIHRRIRLLVQVSIITAIVTCFHLLLKTWWPEMRDALGPYLGLVITNCLVMDSCNRLPGAPVEMAVMKDGEVLTALAQIGRRRPE